MTAVEEDYRYRLYLDELPSATMWHNHVDGHMLKKETLGTPVGRYMPSNGVNQRYELNNVWVLHVRTRPMEDTNARQIVGFDVEPRSYKNLQDFSLEFKQHEPLYLDELLDQPKELQKIEFSYSIVSYEDTTTEWHTRFE